MNNINENNQNLNQTTTGPGLKNVQVTQNNSNNVFN